METEKPSARYAVDPAWYERNGSSFEVVVEGRMCRACQGRLGEPMEETYTTVDSASGRVITQRRTTAYGSSPLPIIRDCCSHTPGYFAPDLPLTEMLFRLFLARANQPATVDELYAELREYVGQSDRVRGLATETLQRLLDHDRSYGFFSIALPAVED